MAGSVIRQKVCHGLAPSVEAACSWSSPISWSTGSTSRTTKGSVTKIVARIMPGRPKITLKPARSRPQSQRRGHAEDDVDRHRDRDDEQRQVEGRLGGRGGDRREELGQAGREGAPQDDGDRDADQREEVAEGDHTQRQAGAAGDLHESLSSRRWVRPDRIRSTRRVTKAMASRATDTAA